MNKQRVSPILTAAAFLLLLGAFGAYWPSLAGADSAENERAPQATIDDAITYQGYLTNASDVPLSGTYTMQFRIYNQAAGGTLLWSSPGISVPVTNGLFEVELATTDDIFNGEELWIAPTINSETLTPRQEVLPAPMAHTLRPGAIIKATSNAIPNNYAVHVEMNNDSGTFGRGAITGQTTTGNAIYGLAPNGRAIYGQTQNGHAIYGFDGGTDQARGYAGYFYSTNGIGVYGYSGAERTGDNLFAPGVYGESNQGVGVYGRGDTSDSHSFRNEGGHFEGGSGVYGRGTDSDGYGGKFYSAYRGIFAQGISSRFDGYFGNGAGISASNVLDRGGRSQSLVVNLGETTISSGDLVSIVGIAENPDNGEPMVGVAKLSPENRNGVMGVAGQTISADPTALEDGSSYIDFAISDDPIAPGSYFVIITEGLAAAVNVDSLARDAQWSIGDKIAVSGDGQMARDAGEANAIVIGRAAGPVDPETNTMPILIDID